MSFERAGARRFDVRFVTVAQLAKAAWLFSVAGIVIMLTLSTTAFAEDSKGAVKQSEQEQNDSSWKTLFNGKNLDGWKITKFGGEGDVYVKNGNLILDFGASLTGANYTKTIPKIDYEIRLEAMRTDGSDFFCGLTFPVKDSCCSLIVGGWGGGIVGISSLDGFDASENATTNYIEFENDKWYALRVQVRAAKIQVWLDGKRIIDEDIRGRRISVRDEVSLSRPFGIATWDTRGALRKIQIRQLGKEKSTK